MIQWSRCLPALICLSVAFAEGPASAQTIDGRVWAGLSMQERSGTSSRWRWASDITVRSREGVSELDNVVFRGALGYDVSRRSSIWGGYGLIPSFPASGGRTIEHRVFAQYQFVDPLGGGSLSLRTRFERRAIEDNSGPSYRLRQQMRFTRPLSPASHLSLVFYDELSVNANTTTRNGRGLDQNRAFAGLSRTITPAFRIEFGYLNQFQHLRVPPDRLNHIASVTAALTF